MHIERARHKPSGAHNPPVDKRDARGAAAFDDDAIDIDLRLVGAARRDEGLHQTTSQVERAALAELIAAVQVEGANNRAHRTGFGQGVGQPGAEQRDLEEEEKLDVLVLEQLIHHIERLAPRDLQEVAADRRHREQPFAFSLQKRLGIALGNKHAARNLLGFPVPLAEHHRVLLREPRDIDDGLFQIASEH
jgi:hypothetical protein